MYQIYVWNRMHWDDTQLPQIYTTQSEAVADALIHTRQDFNLDMCAVFEDGYDFPHTIIYDGREFLRKPLSNSDHELATTRP